MAGLACFIISLLVPTMELVKSQTLIVYGGLQSNVFALGLLNGAFGVNGIALIGLVGVTNVSFFLTPLVLTRCVSQKLLLVLGALVLTGIFSAIYSLFLFMAGAFPLVLAALHFKLLYGFYLWLTGYLFQIFAVTHKLWNLQTPDQPYKRNAPRLP